MYKHLLPTVAELLAPPAPAFTLILVRHGQTVFNTTGQVQGFADSPLTDKGAAQAIQTGDALANVPFSAAFCGDLGRQIQTAELVLRQNKHPLPPLTPLYGLREWYFGSFEGGLNRDMWEPVFREYGLSYAGEGDFKGLMAYLDNRGMAEAIHARDPKGEAETYDAIIARTIEALRQILSEARRIDGGTILLVSSVGEIATLLELLVPDQYDGELVGNASITTLHAAAGGLTLERLGDMRHHKA